MKRRADIGQRRLAASHVPDWLKSFLFRRRNWRQPEVGSGSGGRSCRRSADGVLFGPNTFSSCTHKTHTHTFYGQLANHEIDENNRKKPIRICFEVDADPGPGSRSALPRMQIHIILYNIFIFAKIQVRQASWMVVTVPERPRSPGSLPARVWRRPRSWTSGRRSRPPGPGSRPAP